MSVTSSAIASSAGIDTRLRIAILGIGAFLGCGLVWSALAPLDSALIAEGRFIVEGSRLKVQHVDGGTVASVMVREGARVGAGDPLIVLDTTEPAAQRAVLKIRQRAALARAARLRAERDGASTLTPPPEFGDQEEETNVAAAIAEESRLFLVRREAFVNQNAILDTKIAQLQAEIDGVLRVVAEQRLQVALWDEELGSRRALAEKGYERRLALRSMERERSETAALLAREEARIAEAHQTIAETRMRRQELAMRRVEEASAELREVNTELEDVRQRLAAAEAQLARTTLRAPASGHVLDLSVTGPGAVIRPGDTVLEIVPDGTPLAVEIKVRPSDAESLAVGALADLRLSSHSDLRDVQLKGRVSQISADSLEDERSGDPYFSVRIDLQPPSEPPAKTIPDVRSLLTPGLPVEVVVRTGRRTAMEYLLEPLRRGFDRAMTEE